jgi:hypothetical protein
MRDLNLGPDTQVLLRKWAYQTSPGEHDDLEILKTGHAMAQILERWVKSGWCWIDACPAWVCHGPHVLVKYTDQVNGKKFDVIEEAKTAGTTFEGMPHVIITGRTGPESDGRSTELPAARNLRQDGQP